jgi:hypothetical protein
VHWRSRLQPPASPHPRIQATRAVDTSTTACNYATMQLIAQSTMKTRNCAALSIHRSQLCCSPLTKCGQRALTALENNHRVLTTLFLLRQHTTARRAACVCSPAFVLGRHRQANQQQGHTNSRPSARTADKSHLSGVLPKALPTGSTLLKTYQCHPCHDSQRAGASGGCCAAAAAHLLGRG